MSDVGLGELLVRMVVSLIVVLGLVLGAYAILRRRQGLPSGRGEGRARRTRLVRGRSAAPGGKTAGARRGLKVVGRVGVSRTSSVIAVQFADRVLMIGTSEQAPPNVLAEVSLGEWTEATDTPDPPEHVQPLLGPTGALGARPGILDALREATTRRG